LQLDWRRFVTAQTVDFIRNEAAPLREATPTIPVTTNLMEMYAGLDYWTLARELDIISWDSYPLWHMPDPADRDLPDLSRAAVAAFHHDLFRSLGGGRPFLLMESTPSATNWQPVSKLKRPGMHLLSSLQAVAHGSDSVLYFQWRKGRGGSEKFHGAVVDHVGHEHTRVFRDVAEVGEKLARLSSVVGATTKAEVAVVFDWENWWAIDHAAGPRIEKRDYPQTCMAHHRAFWELGVPVDIVGEDSDLSSYRVVVAPMLHMVRPGVAERLEEFVRRGGCLVTTYWSGIVDESAARIARYLVRGDRCVVCGGTQPCPDRRGGTGFRRTLRMPRALRTDPRRGGAGAGRVRGGFLRRHARPDGEPIRSGGGVPRRLAE
jgi:beta-galactosidase